MKKLLLILYIFCAFTSGAQTIKVIATLKTNSGGGGGGEETPFIIVDNNTKGDQGYQHSYVGNWTDGPPSGVDGFYDGTLSYSNTTNDYVSLSFNGTKVEWYTETKLTHGNVAVSIDGGAETIIDLALEYTNGLPTAPGDVLSSTAHQQVLVYSSGTLTQDVHNIRLRVTGTKNASSTGYYAIHDYLKIFNPGVVPETPDPEPYDRFWGVGGTDAGTCSTLGSQCATLRYTLTQAVNGDKVKGGVGTFVESGGYIIVPTGVSIWGAGIDATTIKLNAALNYTSATDPSKAMFQYSGGTGNQTLKDLSIEGNGKLVCGGIYVNRNNVDFDNIRISNFDRFGLYVKGTDNSITNSEINNSAFSSTFSTGAVLVAATTDFVMDNVDISEGEGYAVKAYETQPIISRFILKNSFITVTPLDGSSHQNIAVELHDCYPRNCQFNSNTFEGNLSLVHPTGFADDGINSVKVHNNIIDMKTRGNTNQAGIEWIMHNMEIDSNYFYTFKNAAIYNFANVSLSPAVNLKVHHNIFYASNLTNTNPTGVIRSNVGFNGLFVYNNTIHIPPGSNQTLAMLFTGTGSAVGKNCTNVQFKNNVVYDQSTADGSAGANVMIRMEGTGSYSSSNLTYNLVNGMNSIGSVSGVTYSNNLTSAPQFTGSGINSTPLIFDPFYRPVIGSPLIESGTNVGFPFSGAAPTRGAFEVD